MKITKTDTAHLLHSVDVHGSNSISDYVRFNVDVWYSLEVPFIGQFDAVYQTAQGYYNNDYSTPFEGLDFSIDGGGSSVLWATDQITDIDKLDFSEWLEEYEDYNANAIRSKCILADIHKFLRDNAPLLSDFELGSNNPEDYEFCEHAYSYVLKQK